jgi:hypothetical protein
MKKEKESDEHMVAEMLNAVKPKRNVLSALTSVPRQISDEWHGEGKLLGTGGFSEAVWGPVTLAIGLDLLLNPTSSSTNITIQLLSWRYPIWGISIPLIVSGIFTIIGVILFFIRGRCFASRAFRLIGAGVGIAIWFTFVLLDWFAFGTKHAFIYEHVGLTVVYIRSTQLAWRKFLFLRVSSNG